MTMVLKGVAMAAALLVSAGAAAAQTAPASYKATRDFSYQNPGGVWSYGYGTTGNKSTFQLMNPLIDKCGAPTEGSDCYAANDGLVASNLLGRTVVQTHPSSSIVIPGDALQLHSRNDGQHVIIQFKAPAAGSYKIEGYYQILDNRPNGVAPKIFVNAKDQTRKAFGVKTDVLLTGPADPSVPQGGEKRSFTLTASLKKGDVVQFGLDPAGVHTFDSTAFDATITPVASN